MYQALVRLPAQPETGNRAEETQAHFDWSALLRFLMRLLSGAPRQ